MGFIEHEDFTRVICAPVCECESELIHHRIADDENSRGVATGRGNAQLAFSKRDRSRALTLDGERAIGRRGFRSAHRVGIEQKREGKDDGAAHACCKFPTGPASLEEGLLDVFVTEPSEKKCESKAECKVAERVKPRLIWRLIAIDDDVDKPVVEVQAKTEAPCPHQESIRIEPVHPAGFCCHRPRHEHRQKRDKEEPAVFEHPRRFFALGKEKYDEHN